MGHIFAASPLFTYIFNIKKVIGVRRSLEDLQEKVYLHNAHGGSSIYLKCTQKVVYLHMVILRNRSFLIMVGLQIFVYHSHTFITYNRLSSIEKVT